MITVKDLINLGYKPGKWFKNIIEYVNNHQLSSKDLETVSPKYIEPHSVPIDFYRNIKAESEEEISNIENVISSMNEFMRTPTLLGGTIVPDACTKGKGQILVGGVVVAKNAIQPSTDSCCSVMMTNFGHIDPKKFWMQHIRLLISEVEDEKNFRYCLMS